jgi:hypothetical protein
MNIEAEEDMDLASHRRQLTKKLAVSVAQSLSDRAFAWMIIDSYLIFNLAYTHRRGMAFSGSSVSGKDAPASSKNLYFKYKDELKNMSYLENEPINNDLILFRADKN